MEAHRDKDKIEKMTGHGTKAEILFKCLNTVPAAHLTEEWFEPRQVEAATLFEAWDELLPEARRMERELKPKAKAKSKR